MTFKVNMNQDGHVHPTNNEAMIKTNNLTGASKISSAQSQAGVTEGPLRTLLFFSLRESLERLQCAAGSVSIIISLSNSLSHILLSLSLFYS